jgi:TadE-like protein
MVEVALVLPIFIFTLMAVLEMGYFAIVGSAVSSASREAARYGATVGCVDGNCEDSDNPQDYHYLDCAGIRDAARLTSGAIVDLTDAEISIDYVVEGSLTPFNDCPVSGPPPAVADIDRWDRVVVTVRHSYEPITPFLRPIMGTQEMTSIDRRSIVKP